jgi:hypothetical protein
MSDKKKLYVIGGKSRTGKSKIAAQTKVLRGSMEILLTDSFRPNGNDDLAWINLMNFLTKTQFSTDVLIEGVAITPQRVHSQLTLDHLILERVVFLGYGHESHADSILACARREPSTDWVAGQLRADPDYENKVRSWMQPGIRESFELKKAANEHGYGYFDITDYPIFEEYQRTVTNYLFRP